MTRQEQAGTRDLGFNNWIREKLPDSSTGFLVSDLDFIVENYKTKRIMLLEVKTRNAQIKTWQKMLFANINKWIAKGIDKDWQYLGFHLLQIGIIEDGEITGDILFDHAKITLEELKKILSLELPRLS